jgi:hypothetical protein
VARNRTRSDRRHARAAATHKRRITESKAVLLILLWFLAGDSFAPLPSFGGHEPAPAPACGAPAEGNRIIIPEDHQRLFDPNPSHEMPASVFRTPFRA